MALTNQERRQFKEEGYLIKRSVLDPSDLEAIRNGLHQIVRREAERARDDGLIDETFPGASFERQPALLAERFPEHIMRILAPIYSGRFSGPEMFSIIVHPKMLAVVEDFVGETIIGSSVYRVRPKLPNWTRGRSAVASRFRLLFAALRRHAHTHMLDSAGGRRRTERLSMGRAEKPSRRRRAALHRRTWRLP